MNTCKDLQRPHLFIIEPNAHEPGHYSSELLAICDALSTREWHISVLTPFGFFECPTGSHPCAIQTVLVDKYDLRLAAISPYGYQGLFYWRCAQYLEHHPGAIVHIWGCRSTFPLWLFLRHSKTLKLTFMTVKGIQTADRSSFLSVLRTILSLYLRMQIADHYITHTDTLHRILIHNLKKESMCSIVPTGVREARQNLTREDARRHFGLPLYAGIILLYGVHRPEKATIRFINLFSQIPPCYHILIAGYDRTLEGIMKTITSLDIAARAHVNLAYIPSDLEPYYYRAANVVAISHDSAFQGESGVLLDAMAYRVPVLAAEGTHAAGLVEKWGIGEVFSYSDAQSLHRACLGIDAHVATLADRCDTFARTQSYDKMSMNLSELYQSHAVNYSSSAQDHTESTR